MPGVDGQSIIFFAAASNIWNVSCLQVQTGGIAAAVIREAFNTVLCEALKRTLTRFSKHQKETRQI